MGVHPDEAEVGEIQDSLTPFLSPALLSSPHGVFGERLNHGMAVICEAEAEAYSQKELVDQETAILRKRLAEQEAESQRLRQELVRRQQQCQVPDPPLGFDSELQAPENEESDSEEDVITKAKDPQPTQRGSNKEQPLAHELREVRQKIMSLGRQLEHEQEVTARLEQERRQVVGYDPFMEAYQASSSLQRELQRELKTTTRNLSGVMAEYHQQWSSLTAQVDMLEQYASLCEREGGGSHLSSPSLASLPRSASLPNGAWPTASSPVTDPPPSSRGSHGRKPRPRHYMGPAPHSSNPSERAHEKERSPSPRPARSYRRSPSPSKAGDEIDQLWCRALRRFPEREDWVLVKERPGVYRLGHPGGRAVHSRVTHAGLQVRVGGGWMNAEAFLRRVGNAAIPPAGMTAAEFISGHGVDRGKPRGSGTATLPTGRILSPTKSWASRIGIPKTPDFRSQRRIVETDADDVVDEEGAADVGALPNGQSGQEGGSSSARMLPSHAPEGTRESSPYRRGAAVIAAPASASVLGSTALQARVAVSAPSGASAVTLPARAVPLVVRESPVRSTATMSPRPSRVVPTPASLVAQTGASVSSPLPAPSGFAQPHVRSYRVLPVAAATNAETIPAQSLVQAGSLTDYDKKAPMPVPATHSWVPSRGSSMPCAPSASWTPSPMRAT